MAASYVVEGEFAGVGGGWTDVTPDICNTPMRLFSGFQSNDPDDLVGQPPTWTFLLNSGAVNGHLAGYYNPDHANCRSGFDYNIRFRLRIIANGNTRTVAFGWLEDILPSAGAFSDQTTTCTVVGWLGQAATTSVSALATPINKTGDQLLALLVAQVAAAPAATSYGAGASIYPYAFYDLKANESFILDGIDSVARSGLDRIFEKADGTLVFEPRTKRQIYTAPVITFADTIVSSTTPGLALMAAPGERRRATILNQFTVAVHPSRVDSSPVVLGSLSVSSSSASIAPGQTVTFQIPYVDPNQTAQQIAAFNTLIKAGGGSTIGTTGDLPTADYSFFSSPLGVGTDYSASVAVSVVFGANQATVTVTNNATHIVFPALVQVRGQGIYTNTPVYGPAENAVSQAQVGQRRASIDCVYNADPSFAFAAATYLTALYSTKKTQFDRGIGFFTSATDEVSMDTLLQREISDAVAVTENTLGISAGAYWANNRQLLIDERCNITFTFGLAPNLAGVAWALGVAGAGELGAATYVQGF